MASNLPSNAASSKIASAAQASTPSNSQGGLSSNSSGLQARSGGSGSFGAGASTRASGGAPRNKQTSKSQHKQSKRFRLADEDAIAESMAMRSFNSRKGQTSITHLMNFSLPPRPTNSHQSGPRGQARNRTWGLGSGYHAVDKARYVHANYRFIVDPRKDYKAQSVDADVYLEWNTVMQILASPESQSAACPICLGDPVAPRMAKCGHIFCLHCLIRYMHSSDETDHAPEKRARYKKCPLCWDSIYITETRPVRWYYGQEGPAPREGEDIVLRLVMRPAGSTLALPKEIAQSMTKEEDIPWHFAADVMDYARVMKGTEDYMTQQFDEEINRIKELEKHDELMFGEDTEWTGKAIRAIRESKDKLEGVGNPPKAASKPEELKPKKKPIVFNQNDDDVPEMYKVQHAAKSGQSLPSQSMPQEKPSVTADPSSATIRSSVDNQDSVTSALSTSIAQIRSGYTHSQTPSDYYFYQALLHYYLSPLDIRILKSAFGDFSVFPTTILPRVERISTGHVVDDDLRRRTKYLAHLPHGCEVNFLECDWTDTVGPETLEQFKGDIERRRKRHLDKATKEEKERIRAEKEEDDKRYAAARRKRPSSPSERSFRPDDFQPLAGSADTFQPTSPDAALESTSPVWTSRKTNGSSFASLASPSTSPHNPRTVWGTTVVTPSTPPMQAQDTGAQDDGWLQGWERELLAEDELVAQVQAASLAGESSSSNPPPASVGKGKKKKQKITLMSNNARRGA